MIVLLMGVSGSGKTTVGEQSAERLRCSFAEGDDFHPPENVAKMQGGTPLDDTDRWPWLLTIAEQIDAYINRDHHLVVACSALKVSYRTILIGDRANTHLVYLNSTRDAIRERMAARAHFMPPALLDSQFAALEIPGEDERPITVDIRQPPEDCAALIMRKLKQRHRTVRRDRMRGGH